MFRKTDTTKQLSLQSSVYHHLPESTSKQFEDRTKWHNIFYKQVVSRIKEETFSVLFSSKQGSPNASVRIMIGMMILKEGEGYSDQKLFENCRFNLLTRKSLGLLNIDDPLPAESTYYLLRKRISDYYKQTGIDLFENCLKDITKGQLIEFEVSGQSIRMDSKLIGSNIAFYSRYELIHSALVLFHKHVYKNRISQLSMKDRTTLEEFIKEKSSSTVYNSSKNQITERLVLLGNLIYTILGTVKENNNPHYQILKQVFDEQYKVEENNKIEIIPSKEISAKSIQSPHDNECDFRKKNDKKTKGYNHNISETCDPENAVNLITDIQTAQATHPDNEFTESAIKNSQEILQDKIKDVHADGAYNSEDNQSFIEKEDINFYLTGFQGAPSRYDLTIQDGRLHVIDTQTNREMPVELTKNNKYRITTEKGYRYFTDKQVESCRLRKQVEQLPRELKNKRNNVEASIFQLAYHLRKDKTKYRGFFKNKIWAILRSLWVNFVRITNYLVSSGQNSKQNVINSLTFTDFVIFLRFLLKSIALESHKNLKLEFH